MAPIRRTIRRVARKARGPIKAVARAAKREAINQAKRAARQYVSRNPLLGSALRTITGSGDYHFTPSSLVHGNMGTGQAPSFGRTQFRMRRRELIGTVVSSPTAGEFDISTFRVNPGIASTFPWLSGIANNFESWKPHGIALEFVSSSGDAVGSTNTALGTVILAPQYNPYGNDPTDRLTLEGFPGAQSCVPASNLLLGLECRPKDRQATSLLIRNSNVNTASFGSSSDSLFDLCDVFVATVGCQGTSVTLGELWLTYDIELFNPVVPTVLPFNQWLHIEGGGNLPATQLFNADQTGSQGTYRPLLPSDASGVIVPNSSTLTLNNVTPNQFYHVNFRVVTNASGTAPGFSISGTGSPSAMNYAQSPDAGTALASGDSVMYDFYVRFSRGGTQQLSFNTSDTTVIHSLNLDMALSPNDF